MLRVCFNVTFDEATERCVRSLWQRLVDAGITAPALPRYRPHVSLACYDVPDITVYEAGIVGVAAATPPFHVRLDSLGIFPEAGVVFLAPRVSHELFGLHRAIVHAFDGPGRPPVVDERLLPDFWMPHCTLAVRLTPEQMLTVVDTCRRYWAPLHGQATGIGMRLLPVPRDHGHYPFQQSAV